MTELKNSVIFWQIWSLDPTRPTGQPDPCPALRDPLVAVVHNRAQASMCMPIRYTIPWAYPLTIQNGRSTQIGLAIFVRPMFNSPYALRRTVPPKLSLSVIHVSLGPPTPTHRPKGHLYRFSRFSTILARYQRTNRLMTPTERTRNSICTL